MWSTIVSFFCCLGFIVPLEEFFAHMETSTLPAQGCEFYLFSALMAIEHWGFFSVPHLVWHGASLYNGHIREHVTLTPIAEPLAVELPLPIFTTYVCHGWDSNTQLSACGAHALTDCATIVYYESLGNKKKTLVSQWGKGK